MDSVVQALVAALKPERIYVFGSHAQSEANTESDLDLFVVVPDDDQRVYDKTCLAYRALRGLPMPKDLVVTHASAFLKRSAWLGSLEREVVSTGKLIYGA